MSRNSISKQKRIVPLFAYYHSKSPITEQYRLIRNNLQFASVDKEIKTVVITSPEPSDGKTTTSVNLAIVLAQQDKQVLLVDADLRKPSIHYGFNLSNLEGLTNVLTKEIDLHTAIKKTMVPNLDLLTSGTIPPNPSELLDSKAMKSALAELKTMYDYIVIDTPPLLAVTDSQIMANKSDGVVLVVANKKTRKDRALKAKDMLDRAKSHLLGVVMNGVESKDIYYGHYG